MVYFGSRTLYFDRILHVFISSVLSVFLILSHIFSARSVSIPLVPGLILCKHLAITVSLNSSLRRQL